MAYDKNTWQSGDVVTSAKLNNIENGIANLSNAIVATETDTGYTLSVSYNDVLDIISNGILPFTVIEDEGAQEILVCAYYWAEEGSYDVSFYAVDKALSYDFVANDADALLATEK